MKQINTLWLSGRLTRLREFVDDNVVMITPLFAERYNGAQALMDSLQAFTRSAQVKHFADSLHTVDVWGDSAMATFRFDMRYAFDGVTYEDAGHEAWMFARRDGRWRLTWRHQVPLSHKVVSEAQG